VRFFLLDRITSWEPGKRATAVKNVALSEDFFEDHFPLKPIMPGVLILEGMAQLGGLLLEDGIRRGTGRNLKALMSIVEKAKFRSPVKPGETLEYSTEILSVNEAGGKVAAKAQRDGTPVAECVLVFSFFEYDNPRAEAHRAKTLSLWMKDLEPNEAL
jgi:3-hydroxyacyl-[acyl-carrier-protein] dehydratase